MTLTTLHSADDPLFEQLLELYRESFPATERKPDADLRDMIHRPIYRILALHQGPVLVGIAILATPLSASGITLLEYLAIAPAHRGSGLGRQLLSAVAAHLPQAQTLLTEAEAPEPQDHSTHARRRRLRFYRSLGARTISGLVWRMPQVASAPPPPMCLLVLTREPVHLPLHRLRTWLTAIYDEVYGRPTSDPALDAMLLSLPDPVPLT